MIILTEDELINAFYELLITMDADDLAELTGEAFGGKCFTDSGEDYFFTPNGDYGGVFNNKIITNLILAIDSETGNNVFISNITGLYVECVKLDTQRDFTVKLIIENGEIHYGKTADAIKGVVNA
jgi:hypothetical protein